MRKLAVGLLGLFRRGALLWHKVRGRPISLELRALSPRADQVERTRKRGSAQTDHESYGTVLGCCQHSPIDEIVREQPYLLQ